MFENEKYVLLSQHFKDAAPNNIHVDLVGQKAIGLFFLPSHFTLPFLF